MNKHGYTDNYNIIKPDLKSNITGRPVKYNPVFGKLENCFNKDILSEFNLKGTSFDFFIFWNDGKTSGTFNQTIWFKRVVEFDNANEVIINANDNFIDKLMASDPEHCREDDLHFLSKYNLDGYYMIIKDSLVSENSKSNGMPIALSIPLIETLSKDDFKVMTLEDIESSLVVNSGGRFSINKPLNYSTTSLEHFLAKDSKETGALWPGDCDLIIYDENYECKIILEFKKCTQYGNIPIEYQSFDNYTKDKTKYKRLAILRDYLSNASESTIPLITVFYPTTDEKYIKIQSIGGSPSNLYEDDSKLLEIPSSQNKVNQFKKDLICELMKI